MKTSYLDLWFLMKLGPCLRNSVVSPKIGQPIVPGGKPFLMYLISFHLNNIMLNRHNPNITTKANMKMAMDAIQGTI